MRANPRRSENRLLIEEIRTLPSGTRQIKRILWSGLLLSLGAVAMPRKRFIRLLDPLCEPVRRFEKWPSAPITVEELVPG